MCACAVVGGCVCVYACAVVGGVCVCVCVYACAVVGGVGGCVHVCDVCTRACHVGYIRLKLAICTFTEHSI